MHEFSSLSFSLYSALYYDRIQSKAAITLFLITWPNDNWPKDTQGWPLRERAIMNAWSGSLCIIKLFAINSFPSSIHFVPRKFHSFHSFAEWQNAPYGREWQRGRGASARRKLSVSYAFSLGRAHALFKVNRISPGRYKLINLPELIRARAGFISRPGAAR